MAVCVPGAWDTDAVRGVTIYPVTHQFQRAFPLRHSFRRLCVPQMTFHSDWQFAKPRCWNRSIPRHVFVWPNTGSMI